MLSARVKRRELNSTAHTVYECLTAYRKVLSMMTQLAFRRMLSNVTCVLGYLASSRSWLRRERKSIKFCNKFHFTQEENEGMEKNTTSVVRNTIRMCGEKRKRKIEEVVKSI